MLTSRMLVVVAIVVGVFALCGCKKKELVAPAARIQTVDELLARACELAADCVSATPQDIADCPANLLAKLNGGQVMELDSIVALDKAKQDSILACFDTTVCGRFGGSLANISDSDLLEPLRDCK